MQVGRQDWAASFDIASRMVYRSLTITTLPLIATRETA
jgi:hypothetical protein